VPQSSPWQTKTFSAVFWIGRDCQMTAVKQAGCSKATVRRRQTTCRPYEFWTTVWRMCWRQTSGDASVLRRRLDLHASESLRDTTLRSKSIYIRRLKAKVTRRCSLWLTNRNVFNVTFSTWLYSVCKAVIQYNTIHKIFLERDYTELSRCANKTWTVKTD